MLQPSFAGKRGTRPPDPKVGPECPHCHKHYVIAELKQEPSGVWIAVCPHCGKQVYVKDLK